ncbi:hypothetical protein FFWV33_15190 [Flavobacterium faecale]|uniref:Uncharacterized protein n=1 Tax=Flavobacterium faecale TaxID=1355330 RepID=A0A2S1LGX8_9FLAO|nr:hypothetical protein [Flavobacterium faecale]AWG22776.1 hypothetical protein FFWV33_15190 [Flavobacterium faecale]
MNENSQLPKRTIWNNITILVSVGGLVLSVILAEVNRRANIELENKKLESDLFIKAIDIGNKGKSLKNLTFLLKLGILPKERQNAIQKLTDSIYSDKTIKEIPSDTIGFFNFQFYNNKRDVSLSEKYLRGAKIKIESIDSIPNPLKIIAYSDYQGKLEIAFPKYYSASFIKVIIQKKGFMSREFKMQLPDFGEMNDTYKEIIMIPKK